MAYTINEFADWKIPLEDIQFATNNFCDENIIGKGGFGNVYKGQLDIDGETTNIVARRLDRRYGQGDVEFWNEISVLSNVEHDYIVEFIGYVDEKHEKIIINRDYAKGSLVKYLSDPTLTWRQRLEIASNISEVLDVIHQGKELGYYIIHRNINSFTILLDDDWNPKLSGFEFSIKHPLERQNQIVLCDQIIGTQGYIDPADLKYKGVTHKSDVYCLGVVLFELLCGRKAKDDQDNKLLASLAKIHYENGTLQDIIHPDLWNQYDQESFKGFSKTAYSCLNEDRAKRPDAGQVNSEIFMAQIIEEDVEKKSFGIEYDEDHQKLEDDMKNQKDPEDESYTNDEDNDDEQYEDEHSFHKVLNNSKHLRIKLDDILLATEIFSKRYFIGSIIEVDTFDKKAYIVQLECFDKEDLSSSEWNNTGVLPKRWYNVKIKVFDLPNDEVYNEIEILSKCKHRNIETLLGFCKTSKRMILVYEYFATKYLADYLEGQVLTWEKRLKICLDIASGLNYLHHEIEGDNTIIHHDINCTNIEVDDDMAAKVIGFGKAVYLPPNQDDDALNLDAPHDYDYFMDPEYIETGKLKRESDVYSFGAIMFEILLGSTTQLGDDARPDELVRGWLDEGIISRNMSRMLMGENGENNFMLNKGPNQDSLSTFINIASQCFAKKQNQRPTVKVIIKELEKALSFQVKNKDILRMSIEDIKLATQDFNCANDIGGGGFGRVFKGIVGKKDGNGQYTIVAKRLDTRHGQGEKQFYNELQILNDYKHVNVIGLVGYSNETDEKIIVYEQAPKGSLDKYLSDANLAWINRLKICIDFATGLDFLHGGGHGKEVVIHRDIKSANILLFDNWKAKIGDFGLSVISTITKKTDYLIDHTCGTEGYLDPLYLKSRYLTLESDIYSIGVVLFEILNGRTTFEIYKRKGQHLPTFIKRIFNEGKKDKVVFQSIKDEIVHKSLTTFQNIAYKCLDDDRLKRPTSKEVLAQLQKAMEFQVGDTSMGEDFR